MRRGAAGCAALLVAFLACAQTDAPGIRFPADTGSHPGFRTEWWYATGWLQTGAGESLGFQVTFFRTRPGLADDNPSAFAPQQLIIAHAALSDPLHGRLYQDQRIQRAVFGLVGAATGTTHAWIDDWNLQAADRAYVTRIDAEDFGLALRLKPTQPPLLNGADGLSRKGAAAAATSWYYSEPQLQVSGSVTRGGRRDSVHGTAWLDHEWSNEYLEPDAVGWDWIGINLDDGGALMAFRIRGADGQARWAGATWRRGDGTQAHFGPDEVAFTPGRLWTSPRTAIRYPVQWQVRVGSRQYQLQPLMDDQESDTRLSSGTIYWEGAVRALDGTVPAGRGYLELTGYGAALKLP